MSTNRRIYLDFNATAPLVPAARDAMIDAMSDIGNPSSVHAEGRRVRDRLERARNQVATLLGRPREQIVFTSGGTEANWLGVMALAQVADQRRLARTIMTTKLEHPSLKGPVEALIARGWERVETGASIAALALVNHELGTISEIPVAQLVHIDAVQAAGKLALADLNADSVAISAHKIGGPQGVGALAITVDEGLPIVEGGHQERGRRPGTENTLGIIGFGAAAAAVDTDAWHRARDLGAELEAGLRKIDGARIHGDDRPRVGTTINVGFDGARGEAIVMALDLEGISVSTGAACTSGSIQPSAVLLALGLSDAQAREAVRFSLGPTTTRDELNRVLEVLPRIVERARRHHRKV
jgi:cysteine desulfurase